MKQRITIARRDMLHKKIEVAPQTECIGHFRRQDEILHIQLFGIVDRVDHAIPPSQQLAQQGGRETGARFSMHVTPGNLIMRIKIRGELLVRVLLRLQG